VIEEIVGKTLTGWHGIVVPVNPAHLPMGNATNQRGNSRRCFTREMEGYLRRLQASRRRRSTLLGAGA